METRMAELVFDEEALMAKIRALPPEKAVEVEDFVDFLRRREDDRRLVEASAALSADTFARVWDNPHDAAYDQL
jgi:hypothetical protein